MPKRLTALMLLCILALTGCYDAVDLNEQLFAVNLALDKGENAALRLTVQTPQIVPTGKEPVQTDSDLQKNGYVLQQVEGETLSECLHLMRMVTPRSLSLMQLRGVYLSKAIAADGERLRESIAVLSDARIVRSSAQVYVTNGRAEDVLKAQLPLFGTRLSKAQAAQVTSLQTLGVIPSAPLKRFCTELNRTGTGALAVLAAVNEQGLSQAADANGASSAALYAGELPRRTADTVDLCGSVLIGQEGLLFLDGYETQLLNLLHGDLKSITLRKSAEEAGIELRSAPRIRVRMDGETPLISIKMPVRTDSSQSEQFTQILYHDALALLLKLQQNGLDAIGLADRARTGALTYTEWEEMAWEENYRKAVWEIGE